MVQRPLILWDSKKTLFTVREHKKEILVRITADEDSVYTQDSNLITHGVWWFNVQKVQEFKNDIFS